MNERISHQYFRAGKTLTGNLIIPEIDFSTLMNLFLVDSHHVCHILMHNIPIEYGYKHCSESIRPSLILYPPIFTTGVVYFPMHTRIYTLKISSEMYLIRIVFLKILWGKEPTRYLP